MRISRIFVDITLSPESAVSIQGEQAHYLRNVLRLKSGDELIVFNGTGGEFSATINRINKDSVDATTGQFNPINRQSELSLELGLAVIKRDAMDFAIQKSVELGVSRIQPLITDRVSVAEKHLHKRQQHWQKIAVSSCEQCGLNIVPFVLEPMEYRSWISSSRDLGFIASLQAKAGFPQLQLSGYAPVRIAIGPEGGLTGEEEAIAFEAGFAGISLGQRVLRAETAAISILTLAQNLLSARDS